MRKICDTNGHAALTLDADGSDVLIWTSNQDNGIYKVPIDGRPRTILTQLAWPIAADISCPAQGPPILSTYSLDPDFPGQALRLHLDGSGFDVLCETGSVQIKMPDGSWAYNSQPKACVSRDGRFILGCSNFGKTTDPNYCDLWLWDMSRGHDIADPAKSDPIPSNPLQSIPSGLHPVKFPPNKDYWIRIQTDAQGNPTVTEFEN